MNIKKLIMVASVATTTTTLVAAVPEVSGVTMTQAISRLVTINYTLADAPAVITLDVQTNANTSAGADDPGWTSIGGEAVCNAEGDVWKKVGTSGTFSGTITWRPDISWPDHKIANGGARAVVTAWALDNTPDYMAVDISAAAQPNTQTYYPSADFVPGGVIANTAYRTTKLLMRKIMAKGVEWTMGSTKLEEQRNASREDTHQVVLTNNYYIGVFPVTQSQWGLIQANNVAPSHFANPEDRAMRPVEKVCYNEIRNAANSKTENTAYNWPAAPNPGSFLGILRTRSGIDSFDLPSEAQWEFAARAGNGSPYWGDGSAILNVVNDANLSLQGRFPANGGFVNGAEPASTCRATNGTAIVGTYRPNSWGIYDMFGNVWEWCLDWHEDNILSHGGALNINPSNGAKTLSGANGSQRERRGGSWSNEAQLARPAQRAGTASNNQVYNTGFRVVCTAGLQ